MQIPPRNVVFVGMCLGLLNCAGQSSSDLSPSNSFPNVSEPSPTPIPLASPNGHLKYDSSKSLRYLSPCAYGAITHCLAGFGFSIDDHGNYRVGPGPRKEQLTGHITHEEFKPLEWLFRSKHLMALQNKRPEVCVEPFFPTDTTVGVVSFHQNDQYYNFIHLSEMGFCYREIMPIEATIIFTQMRILAAKYYPLPFPGRWK